MSRIARSVALGVATFAGAVTAQAPEPKDFAHGLRVTPAAGVPVQQFTVPDRVYQGVARADLGDLRVFNGGGGVVPHALCTEVERSPASVREAPLAVFALQAGAAVPGGDTRVDVATPAGTSVQIVEGGGAGATPAAAEAFVVDATAVHQPLRALQLAWHAPDGASQAQVRVEASDDLDRWRTIVQAATLLQVAANGATLDRNRIELPEGHYRYLRLARGDGPAVRIERVTAELIEPGAAPEPFRFAADPVAAGDPGEFQFETGRVAPVHTATVELWTDNMVLGVSIESRTAPDAPWQRRWSGDVSSVRGSGGDGAQAGNGAAFAPVTDRYWRVRVWRGAESLGGNRPTLRLGYHPARLRFLRQGDEPFVVAYGSARVPPADAPACDALLATLPRTERASLIGLAAVEPAPAGAFGGAAALTPPPQPTPVRQIVLWLALVLGTAVVVAMALSLLRRLREGQA